jgi:hypothetical protein
MTDAAHRRDLELKALRFCEHERRLSMAQLAGFVILAVAAILGFWRIGELADADRRASRQADLRQQMAAIELCLTQQQGREARREDVRAIADLGRSISTRPEVKAAFDRFERDRLAEIAPITCPPRPLR